LTCGSSSTAETEQSRSTNAAKPPLLPLPLLLLLEGVLADASNTNSSSSS
jgi:hypothetical protein